LHAAYPPAFFLTRSPGSMAGHARLRLRLVLPLLLALLFVACGGDKAKPTPTAPAGVSSTPPATAAATVTGTPLPTATLPPAAPIAWSNCGSFQCARFDVPLDYADPSRASMTLSLMRQPARDQQNRIGTLFVNPGGPGGSAIDFLRFWAPFVDRDISNRFDIVAFDPRGVGESSAIHCHDNLQEIIALPPDPKTDAEWQQIIAANQKFADECKQKAGAVLPYLGTANVARDMDRIREALGEEKITYVGYSYGTVIGQVYADLFPTHVRAILLDGVVDIAEDADQRNLDQTIAFEAALNRYVANCRATSCLPRDPKEAIDTLIATAAKSPIPAPDADRPLSESEVLWAIAGSLYGPSQASGLTAAISQALNGNGTRMIRLVDSYFERDGPNGDYSNLFESNTAVNCLDFVSDRNPQHYRDLIPEFAKEAPEFGAWFAQAGVSCALWPVDPTPLKAPKAQGSPSILVLGNTGDPATPYKWAVAVSKQLASSMLLTYDGEGHTAYILALNHCVNESVDSYLVDLTLPEPGTVCGSADIAPAPPVKP
jgi:pimeloyl-ACP methyl ester carboxylesterase